jgi:hypothetical protein
MSTSTPTITTKSSYSDLDNKQICNAFGCYFIATETINVDGGNYGTITLSLCSSCKNKFTE